MTGRKRGNLVDGFVALGSLVFLFWIIPTFTPPYPGYGVSSALLPSIAFTIILLLSVVLLGSDLWSGYKTKSKSLEEDQADEISQNDRVHLWHLASFMIPCLLLMPVMR